MKEIKCDGCGKVICSNSERFIGLVQRVSNEERETIRYLVLETMDFCSIDCLSKYVEKKYRG